MSTLSACVLCDNSRQIHDPVNGAPMPCQCTDDAELSPVPAYKITAILDAMNGLLSQEKELQGRYAAVAADYAHDFYEGRVTALQYAIRLLSQLVESPAQNRNDSAAAA